MAKVLGIDFEPLNTPLKHRLQLLLICTIMLLLSFTKFFVIGLFIYLCFTDYYFVPVLYYLWVFYDRQTCYRDGRRSALLANFPLWKYLREFFPISLIKTAELNPNKNYIFALHPHGVVSGGNLLNFGTEQNSTTKLFQEVKLRPLVLTSNFYIPIAREFSLALGGCSCAAETINYIFTKKEKGNAVILVPGGGEEIIEAQMHSTKVVLKNKKGFVKMALRYGADLVPVYTFGETSWYSQPDYVEGSFTNKIHKVTKALFGFPIPLINGRGLFQRTFGILPHKHPVCTVVGNPIEVEKVENPSKEILDKYHDLYMTKLRELFDEYKHKVEGPFKDKELIII